MQIIEDETTSQTTAQGGPGLYAVFGLSLIHI